MKKQIFFFLICWFGLSNLSAQKAAIFTSSISIDSILLGNTVEVKFSLKNAEMKEFYAPNFEGFEVMSGPNRAISTSIINGQMSSSATYTYSIKPIEIGDYFIPPASVEIESGMLESEPIAVQVVPNPDGIIQQPKNTSSQSIFGENFFGRNPFDDPFFKQNPFDNPLFRNPADSLQEQKQQQTKPKKKRKVTRI